MTPLERKIEAALEAWCRDQGYEIVVINCSADHVAQMYVTPFDDGDDSEVSINLTECAKHIAREVEPC